MLLGDESEQKLRELKELKRLDDTIWMRQQLLTYLMETPAGKQLGYHANFIAQFYLEPHLFVRRDNMSVSSRHSGRLKLLSVSCFS